MITTQELLYKIGKFRSPVLRFEFLPRHRTYIALHSGGFQSEVDKDTVTYFETTFNIKCHYYAN